MITTSRALARLARLHGVEIVRVDAARQRRLVSEDTLWRVLRALRVELASPSDAPEALRAARRAQAVIPPVLVAWEGRVPAVTVRGGRGSARLRVRLTRQTGDTQAWDASADQPVPIASSLPYGYHRLEVSTGMAAHMAVIVSAPRMEVDEDAGFHEAPPSSRLFAAESGIDPCAAEEFQQCEQARILWAGHAARGQVLRALAAWVRQHSGLNHELRRFARSRPSVEDYAAFRALEDLRQEPWPLWPEPQRNGFIRLHDTPPETRDLYLYAEWLAERQGTGSWSSFPLGIRADGFDVWRHRPLFAAGSTLAAPDGGVPLVPAALRATRYQYLIACLRQRRRHAGGFRFPAARFVRQYWMVEGAREGAWIGFPEEEVRAIAALEARVPDEFARPLEVTVRGRGGAYERIDLDRL